MKDNIKNLIIILVYYTIACVFSVNIIIPNLSNELIWSTITIEGALGILLDKYLSK